MKANQSNTESKKFQIPMVVTDEVICDFGIKLEDITWRRVVKGKNGKPACKDYQTDIFAGDGDSAVIGVADFWGFVW